MTLWVIDGIARKAKSQSYMPHVRQTWLESLAAKWGSGAVVGTARSIAPFLTLVKRNRCVFLQLCQAMLREDAPHGSGPGTHHQRLGRGSQTVVVHALH